MNEKNMNGQSVSSPTLISKKDLCAHFGLCSAKGRVYTDRLRLHFITDEILQKLKLTSNEYNCLKTFNFTQSQILIKEFEINL